MNLKRKIAALALASVLTTGAMTPCLAEATGKDALVAQFAGSVNSLIEKGQEDMNIYTNIRQASHADRLPASFDLRERGVVPSIRDQKSFGTCWGFASIAACEISILSDLGMTTKEFIDTQGMEMDLSEKHLAWFSSVPITETEDMTEHDKAQIGEGRVLLNDDGSASTHFGIGGFMGYASGMFASGVGPVPESYVPYTANDGTDSISKDWSVDESKRFAYQWELKDTSILPSPSLRDKDGNYIYNAIGTEMIKQELIDGRAVSIVYHSDQAMDPMAAFYLQRDRVEEQGIPHDSAELFAKVATGMLAKEDLTEEEIHDVRRVQLALSTGVGYEDLADEELFNYVYDMFQQAVQQQEEAQAERPVDESEMTEEELAEMNAMMEAVMEAAERLGLDMDAPDTGLGEKIAEANAATYINSETYAQYTWNQYAQPNHAVTIVGYDDNYPASNFLSDHLPPADGAWIVRNSWGANYGDEGYFYLSYYDRTIIAPETFEFVTDDNALNTNRLMIHEYDYMPAAGISTGCSREPVYLANEFTIEDDSVLSYVSAMTSNLNTNVTIAVYLLNEDSKTPIDGELLDVRTMDFKYAGYHRIPLNQHYLLTKGTKIGIVQTQRYVDADGMYYAVPYTLGANCEYAKAINTVSMQEMLKYGIEGKIARDESFICIDNEWMDWVDFLGEVNAVDPRTDEFVSFDNHSMKIYLYALDEICELHNFGEAIPYAGGNMKLCQDCGYTLVEK